VSSFRELNQRICDTFFPIEGGGAKRGRGGVQESWGGSVGPSVSVSRTFVRWSRLGGSPAGLKSPQNSWEDKVARRKKKGAEHFRLPRFRGSDFHDD
jgi:hypothetical protein